MSKIIFKLLLKVILSIILLFGYNSFLNLFDTIIPINFITIGIVSFLDVPGIIALVLFNNINYQ